MQAGFICIELTPHLFPIPEQHLLIAALEICWTRKGRGVLTCAQLWWSRNSRRWLHHNCRDFRGNGYYRSEFETIMVQFMIDAERAARWRYSMGALHVPLPVLALLTGGPALVMDAGV